MTEESKQQEENIIIDGEKVSTNKLTPEQKYYYNQLMDIQPKLDKLKFDADQMQASWSFFENLLFGSIKKAKEELEEKVKEAENKE